jgi:putative spermidine/putrescine transport system substrate-binding protein
VSIVVASACLAACGSDDDDASSTPTTSATTTPAPTTTAAATTSAATTTSAGQSATTAGPSTQAATTVPRGGSVTTPSGPCVLPAEPITAANQCKFPGETLKVSTTGASAAQFLRDAVGKEFESTTGAKIEWVETGPLPMLSQLVAAKAAGGDPPVDVVIDMYAPTIFDADAAGVFQKITWSDLPNLADISKDAYVIDGYGPASYYTTFSICVNTDKFKEANLPIPTSGDDLSNPAIKTIAFPQPESPRWDQVVAGLATFYGASMDDPDPIIQKIAAFGDRLLFYSAASDSDQMIQSGDAWALITSEGRCFGLAKQGKPVQVVGLGLKGGGKTYDVIGSWVGPQIVTGTKKVDLAKTFINTLFTKNGFYPFTSKLLFAPTKPSVIAAMVADPTTADFVRTTFDDVLRPDYKEYIENREKWINAWNSEFM